MKRITGFEEGEIYELNNESLPLYIWHMGKLSEITPQEFNACVNLPLDKRWNAVFDIRFTNQYG